MDSVIDRVRTLLAKYGEYVEIEPPQLVQIDLDPYSVALRGCVFIYAPAGQAGEYAALAANPYRGCGHLCRYCYVPRVLRMSRE